MFVMIGSRLWHLGFNDFNFCFLQVINYDSPRGGVSVVTEKGESTTSHLLIQVSIAHTILDEKARPFQNEKFYFHV